MIDTAIVNDPDPAGNFDDHVDLLEWAVNDIKPDAIVHDLGTLDGQPIVGSARSGVGIVKIRGNTYVVQLDPGQSDGDLSLGELDDDQILGLFGDP